MFSIFARQACRIQFNVRPNKHFRYFSTRNGTITSSYYHERGTFPLLTCTLGDLVDYKANKHGDDEGIVVSFQNIRKTFFQFKKETDQLAAGLLSLGLAIGDRIAIYGPNSYQWLLTQYAAVKAGLIVVCINPAYTGQELEYVISQVKCRALVCAETFKNKDYYETLCAVLPEIPKSYPGQINSQRFKHLQNIIIISEKRFPGTYRLKDVMEADSSTARQLLDDSRKKIQFDDAACILLTSGTTGHPKAAALSHFNIVNQVKSTVSRLGFNIEPPVLCMQVPLFHGFGNIGGLPLTMICGGKCIIPKEHFSPISSLKAIQEEKCTDLYGTPTMLSDMIQVIEKTEYKLHSLKRVLVGASPVPLELTKILEEDFNLVVMNAYGSTETCGAATGQSPLDAPRMVGGSGKPIEYTEVKIVDKDGLIVPVNSNGEVLVRSPFLFKGYWDEAKKTDEVLDATKWYHTGDIGKMDENGEVYITGRIKDMIIRGGENIYPTEVENFLTTHPSIAEAYVVGVPDERLVEEVCASIKLKNGCTLTAEEVKTFCKDKISYFKIPRYILFCEDYPKTESGKIIKHKLKEECVKVLKL